jgi:hypothetical protein
VIVEMRDYCHEIVQGPEELVGRCGLLRVRDELASVLGILRCESANVDVTASASTGVRASMRRD